MVALFFYEIAALTFYSPPPRPTLRSSTTAALIGVCCLTQIHLAQMVPVVMLMLAILVQAAWAKKRRATVSLVVMRQAGMVQQQRVVGGGAVGGRHKWTKCMTQRTRVTLADLCPVPVRVVEHLSVVLRGLSHGVRRQVVRVVPSARHVLRVAFQLLRRGLRQCQTRQLVPVVFNKNRDRKHDSMYSFINNQVF